MQSDIADLLVAIKQYRYWYDTCSKTNDPNWLAKADNASQALDTAIKRVQGIKEI